MKKKIIAAPPKSEYITLEQVVGCKWSVSVLQAIRKGVHRPGQLESSILGISTKVLSERLRKLTKYGLLEKTIFNEIPPHTEYHLTAWGQKLITIIEQIDALDQEIKSKEL